MVLLVAHTSTQPLGVGFSGRDGYLQCSAVERMREAGKASYTEKPAHPHILDASSHHLGPGLIC